MTLPVPNGYCASRYNADDDTFTESHVSYGDMGERNAAASIAGYIGSGLMGWCGCGMPESALLLLRDSLRALRQRDDAPWEVRYAEQKQEWERLYGGDGYTPVAYWIWYTLADKGLTEHGSSVPGWLTETGKQVLADLESISDYLERD